MEENGIWTNKSSNLSFQYVNPFDKGLRKGNSDTTCNLKTGDLESHIDNRNCALCDKHHEDVHKNDKDNKACCENFAKGCLRQFSESFCRQVRKTWTDENRNSFECDAYKVNSLCCIAVTCASFGGPPDGCNKDSFAMFGFDCENVYSRAEECCKRKKKITKCPFDKNGNYVGGTGKPDLPFCDEMYLPPKPRPFPPRRK